MRYCFEDFAIDTDQRELRRGSELVSVAPQVFDLLEYLIHNRERVVSKNDLINAVWNGRAVSDAALTTRLNVARKAIGDSGDEQRLIRTVPRRGFRFLGQVRETPRCTTLPARSTVAGSDDTQAVSAPRLSIVVLPFANLGGHPEHDYFVDGVTESLTTDLSRISGSFVIGRHTAFAYKGKALDIRQLGRELNVRYVLEGAIQRGSDRLRVSAQLVNAETGAHLWADRFDKSIANLFDMQDEIVSRLANALNTELIEAEARRAGRSSHPEAIDLYFQGVAWFNKGPTPENLAQARSFFERAVEVDSSNVEALVGTAIVAVSRSGGFLVDDWAERLAAAEVILNKALSLAPRYAVAHMYLGAVHVCSGRSAQGIAECEQALSLDRNLASAHSWIGLAKHFLGRPEETEAHIAEALRLSPHDIFAYRWMVFAGIAKVQTSADAEAVAWLRRSIEANRNFPIAHFHLAVALAQLGAIDEARSAARAGLSLNPSFSIRRFRQNLASDSPAYVARRERFYEGLRLAGVPEN